MKNYYSHTSRNGVLSRSLSGRRSRSIFASYSSLDEFRNKARVFLKNKKEYDDEEPLTYSDRNAWWSYMRENYPLNYKLANDYYDDVPDDNLGSICRPRDLNINDYFELYDLPRITAKDCQIRVNGQFVQNYLSIENFDKITDEFNSILLMKALNSWMHEQYGCQNGYCAWCKKRISLDKCEVSHVKPILFFGCNQAFNLVLACERCVKNKGHSCHGWNETRDVKRLNSKPSWIKSNYLDFRIRDAIRENAKQLSCR